MPDQGPSGYTDEVPGSFRGAALRWLRAAWSLPNTRETKSSLGVERGYRELLTVFEARLVRDHAWRGHSHRLIDVD